MSTFIPSITFTDFKKLKVEQLKRLKSAEVTFNGEYLFTFVNGGADVSGYLRLQTEYRCQISNGVCGESLEQILKQEVTV